MESQSASSPRERIIETAERLFAEHGLEGVALRQIAVAAGNANNSAVQYHFGTKEQLIQAIFEHRLPRLTERRRALMARGAADLRSSVHSQARALLEESERDDSHYASFVAMLLRHGRTDVFRRAPEGHLADAQALTDEVEATLKHLTETVRTLRVRQALNTAIYVAADRQRARLAGRRIPAFDVELANLVDGIVGYLTAPMSPEARAAMQREAADQEPVGRATTGPGTAGDEAFVDAVPAP